MNENENKSGGWGRIIAGILLIILLFAGIKLAFWGLERAVPPEKLRGTPDTSASQSAPAGSQDEAEAPSFCVHCGRELPESFEWGQFCPYCGKKVE